MAGASKPETSPMPGGRLPRLLLHCCCAPCASYVFEYLSSSYSITAFYYNPNITPRDEYYKRAGEFQKLPDPTGRGEGIDAVVCDYNPEPFIEAASPYSGEPEGGARCRICIGLRLSETAKYARQNGFQCFTTTLSVSRHKNADMIGGLGKDSEEEHGVPYLHGDFKKNDGYRRSVELSKQYGLYRQKYCGCIFSKGGDADNQHS